jgi:hypothetical protein
VIDVERTAWLALYAAAWFQSTAAAPGTLLAKHRALLAAERADAALDALRSARPEVLR